MRALRGLRKMRESHMIVCVTDLCETSAPLWEKTEDLKKTSVEVLWVSFTQFDRRLQDERVNR